jgi:hypothetical protein
MREAARLQGQNHPAEAIAAYLSIVTRWPKLAEAWYNQAVRGNALRRAIPWIIACPYFSCISNSG